MSVILLSDASGPVNSDEHRAFELSVGGTLTRLTPPEGRPLIRPETEPSRPHPAAARAESNELEPPTELPPSTRLPGSG